MSEPEMETSDQSFKKKMLMKWMDMEEKETGGDEYLFWRETNVFDSAQRINALDSKLCEFRGDCGKFAVDWCVNKGLPDSKAGKNALLAELGLFSEECEVLFEEYVKSAAELCIKKMRLGALMDKCDKRTTLTSETIVARKTWKELQVRFTAFKDKLLATSKQLQDSHTHVLVRENDVGGAPDKSPEIAGGKIKNLESALSNVKLESTYKFRAVGLRRESFRVLVEMMRGVNKVGGQQLVSGLDDAMTLGREWVDALMGKCVSKIWVGTMVDRDSVFELLKREIEENWKMEKQVKDRIVVYQKEQAHLAQGSVTKVGPQRVMILSEKNVGVGAVLEGDETVEVKKSEVVTVVEGNEAIKEKNIGVETVVEGEETVQEKKSNGVAVVEGGDTIQVD